MRRVGAGGVVSTGCRVGLAAHLLPAAACAELAVSTSTHPPTHPLLRSVLGGLWPLTKGRIYKPGGGADDAEGGLSHACFYVPQRPYVTQGSLQEQLIYPLTASAECRIPQPQLRALLAAVDLEHLLERWVGGLGVAGLEGRGVRRGRVSPASRPPCHGWLLPPTACPCRPAGLPAARTARRAW